MIKDKKRNKKKNEEEEFEPYFKYLDEIGERKDFIHEIYRLSQLKSDLNVIFKPVEIDKVDGLPYLVEDLKPFIKLNSKTGVIQYPTYNQREAFPVYKKSSNIPPNGFKSVKGIVQHLALGVVTIILKEVTSKTNDSDTRHLRDIDGDKIENFFIYDFDEEKWKQVDKKDLELNDRLKRIKRLDIVFDEIFAIYHEKCDTFDSEILSNKNHNEFYNGIESLIELVKASKLALYGYLHYGLINDYQFDFLKDKLDELNDSIRFIVNEYAFRKDLFDELIAKKNVVYTIRTPINDKNYHSEYGERFETQLRIGIENLQNKFKRMFSDLAFTSSMKSYLGENIDKFKQSIDINDFEKICFYEGNSAATQFVPTFNYINFKTGKTSIAMKKDEFYNYINIIESLFKPEKTFEIDDEIDDDEESDEINDDVIEESDEKEDEINDDEESDDENDFEIPEISMDFDFPEDLDEKKDE